jgi:hypothetical protein
MPFLEVKKYFGRSILQKNEDCMATKRDLEDSLEY